MKVTLLGHASVLVEVHGRTVLIDPVFADPFAEGAVVSCPARRVHRDRLPRIDLLVLSNSAPDHFDVATLATMPRDCVVVCPQDPVLPFALEKLGFRSVRPTPSNAIVRFGKFDLWTTSSTREVAEFGVALKDRTGSFWTQVDTVPSPTMIDQLRATFGRIDLFLAGYATRNMMYLGTARPGFPTTALRNSIACARRVSPRLVVPGSAGFRFDGDFAWTNAFLFPISRERFVADLSGEQLDLATAIGNPGDVFEIAGGKVAHKPGSSRYAEMICDDTSAIAYDLTAPVPPLSDPNLDAYPIDLLEREVAACLAGLTGFVEGAYASEDKLVEEHRRNGLVYGVEVVFPGKPSRWARFGFERSRPVVAVGEGALRDAVSIHRIAASVLTAWWRDERSYAYTGGLSRRSMMLRASLVNGSVAIDAREPPDLLMYYLAYKRPGAADAARKRVEFRLRSYVGAKGAC